MKNQQTKGAFSLSAVLPKLILRNVVRHLPRLWAMGVALIIIFAVLVLGNTLLAHSSAGFRDVYAGAVTGDLTISDAGAEGFTVFGSEALLVAEFNIAPTMVRGGRLLESVRGAAGVQAATGLVSSLARTETGDPSRYDPLFQGGRPSRARAQQILFGVDFQDYANFFGGVASGGIELVSGYLPEAGEAAVLVQEERFAELQQAFGREDIIGLPLLVTGATETSFAIRELRIAGAFRYRVSDPQLERVALADAATVRALAGYGSGGEPPDLGASDAVDAGDAAVDDDEDFFSEQEFIEEEHDPGIDIDELEQFFAGPQEAADPERAARQANDIWNFVLVRGELSPAALERRIADAGLPPQDYLVRDWRASAGGTAQLVFLLQLLLNAALGFIMLGALTVTANALVLSVLERGAELGTLQAMGAGRSFVAALVAGEAVVFVSLAAGAGVALGAILGLGLNAVGIELGNPLIVTLFGGPQLPLRPAPALLAAHLGAGVLLALLAVVYPLKRVFEISPVSAMSGDAAHA